MIRSALIVIICLCFGSTVVADLVFTTEGDYKIGVGLDEVSYDKGDVVNFDQNILAFDSGVLDKDKVDAIHFLNSNELIFTVKEDFNFNVNPATDDYTKGVLVSYNISTGAHSLFFDPSDDADWNGDHQITAAFLTNNDSLIFAANGNFNFGALRPTETYEGGDLVEYNLTTGATSLVLDRDDTANRDFTSVHVLPDGDFLFTIDGDWGIFQEGDVIRYDGVTASMYLDRDNITGGNNKITALSVVPEPASWMLLLGLAMFMTLSYRRPSRDKVAA